MNKKRKIGSLYKIFIRKTSWLKKEPREENRKFEKDNWIVSNLIL